MSKLPASNSSSTPSTSQLRMRHPESVPWPTTPPLPLSPPPTPPPPPRTRTRRRLQGPPSTHRSHRPVYAPIPAFTSSPANTSPFSLVGDGSGSPPGLLPIAVTGFRLYNAAVVAAFGLSKAISAYRRQSVALTVLDLLLGIVYAVISYWLRLHQVAYPRLFRVDYAFAVVLAARFLAVTLKTALLRLPPSAILVRTLYSFASLLISARSVFSGASTRMPASCPRIVWFYCAPLMAAGILFTVHVLAARVGVKKAWFSSQHSPLSSRERRNESVAVYVGYVLVVGALWLYARLLVDTEYPVF